PRPCLAPPWQRSPTGDPLRCLGAGALTTPIPAITRGLPGAPHTAPPTPVAVCPHKPGGSHVRLTPGHQPRAPPAYLASCQVLASVRLHTTTVRLWGENESLRGRPVCGHTPDLVETHSVSFEITTFFNGIFSPNKNLMRAVNQQSCPGAFG